MLRNLSARPVVFSQIAEDLLACSSRFFVVSALFEHRFSQTHEDLGHLCAQVLAQSCRRIYIAAACKRPRRLLWCRPLKAATQYAAACGVVLLTCGTAASAITADRSPPTAPRVAGPRVTSSTKPVYRFSATDRATRASKLRFRCSFDARRLHACGTRFSQRLERGRHELRAQTVDRAGNRSPVTLTTVTVAGGGKDDENLPPHPPSSSTTTAATTATATAASSSATCGVHDRSQPRAGHPAVPRCCCTGRLDLRQSRNLRRRARGVRVGNGS